ncbi:MAG: hypothetical protein ABFS86_09845 [Planctomycetota bacterium]
MGFTVVEWDFDGVLLPEAGGATCDYGCCDDLRVIVNLRVTAAGGVETLVKGKSVSGEELVTKHLVFAERRRDLEDPDQPSLVAALIRADRRVPWAAVRRVLDACQDPDVRIYRLQFATWAKRH